jgi:hypothetical protein
MKFVYVCFSTVTTQKRLWLSCKPSHHSYVYHYPRESIGPSSRRHFQTRLSFFILVCPNECCFTSIVFVPPQTLPDPYRENHPDGQPCCLNAPQNTLPPHCVLNRVDTGEAPSCGEEMATRLKERFLRPAMVF